MMSQSKAKLIYVQVERMFVCLVSNLGDIGERQNWRAGVVVGHLEIYAHLETLRHALPQKNG